jgi:hypothetical protein
MTMAETAEKWWERAITWILLATLLALLLGAMVLVMLAAGPVAGKSYLSSLASALITAGAAYFLGVFVGCLLGIPQRVLPTADSSSAAAAQAGLYRPGNQLEQISDWLLKVLLGASLTQLGNVTLIGDYFQEFVGSAAGALAIITYFSFVGVLSGYFIMIAYLANVIRQSGEGLMQRVERIAREQVERIATEELDRIAVQHALFQSLYREAPEQEEAVERAEEYLKENPAGTADLYGHLACAYAQRYQRERDAGKPATDPELKQLLDAAVKNAEEAVKRDPEWGPILHDLYYAPADAVEDDWAVFRGPENDPDNKVKSFIDKLQSTARA